MRTRMRISTLLIVSILFNIRDTFYSIDCSIFWAIDGSGISEFGVVAFYL